MTELDEIRTQISSLRSVVTMADSDAMDTRDLLKSQTHLMSALRMSALREVQNAANVTLGEQGSGSQLGGVESQLDGVDGRLGAVGGRLSSVEGRLEDMQDRLDGLGTNVETIMRHFGISV
jgi:archaellum component FlaC